MLTAVLRNHLTKMRISRISSLRYFRRWQSFNKSLQSLLQDPLIFLNRASSLVQLYDVRWPVIWAAPENSRRRAVLGCILRIVHNARTVQSDLSSSREGEQYFVASSCMRMQRNTQNCTIYSVYSVQCTQCAQYIAIWPAPEEESSTWLHPHAENWTQCAKFTVQSDLSRSRDWVLLWWWILMHSIAQNSAQCTGQVRPEIWRREALWCTTMYIYMYIVDVHFTLHKIGCTT